MIKTLDTIKYAALAILKKVAVKILNFKLLGKGQTPWAYYEDKQGKKRATFLKKSEFNGYAWNDNYTEVTNLETGEVYQVNSNSCTCKDWFYRVKTGKKPQCKHQIMRSEYVNDFEINDQDLPPGCFTRKYENPKSIEYRLYAWVRKFNGEEYYPEAEEIGSLIKTQFSGLEAWTKTAINGINFESVNDAVNYLLRKANINLKETEQAYQYAELGF
ncbi:hypothetical protein VB715_18620 [Crocosphaera sp. UHCC 0190]|uniref:hypothetical protein n=1 Tax=Crocosphaera sp. UHCC 0190 TaxID=3110246 RepID=UPI002B1F3684|nr:hypothetical protein [Crocosphaera sp. UHCC 0190]MEA5511790.1 hypothetical protein [Crocosphaera sp. UHCC 0190]